MWKRLALLLSLMLFLGMSTFAASNLAADVLISWEHSPNYISENVAHYLVTVDNAHTLQIPVNDTDALCSELTPPVNCNDGQNHVVEVRAVSDGGFKSVPATLPFGPPSPPANVSVLGQ